MTREEIIEQVNGLLSEEFEVEQSEFTPDANLKDTLQLDSINLVDLIALVQVTYKILSTSCIRFRHSTISTITSSSTCQHDHSRRRHQETHSATRSLYDGG